MPTSRVVRVRVARAVRAQVAHVPAVRVPVVRAARVRVGSVPAARVRAVRAPVVRVGAGVRVVVVTPAVD